MTNVKLVWASNSPDWEDVSCKADSVVIDGNIMRVTYSGKTEEGGRYDGEVAFELREGVQGIEGEYTVYAPKDAEEQFSQVVSFGLTGQIKPLAAGGHYFTGVWDESGVAQAFSINPVSLPGSAPVVHRSSKAFQVDSLPYKALPAAAQAPVKAIRAFEVAVHPVRQQVNGLVAFAEFDGLFTQLDAVLEDIKTQLDALVLKSIDPETLTAYLRDEASLALEQLLDVGAGVQAPVEYPESIADFIADVETLSENLNDTILHAGYELCRVLIGADQAA